MQELPVILSDRANPDLLINDDRGEISSEIFQSVVLGVRLTLSIKNES